MTCKVLARSARRRTCGCTSTALTVAQASLHDVIYEKSFRPYANWDSVLFSIATDVAKGKGGEQLFPALNLKVLPKKGRLLSSPG